MMNDSTSFTPGVVLPASKAADATSRALVKDASVPPDSLSASIVSYSNWAASAAERTSIVRLEQPSPPSLSVKQAVAVNTPPAS